MPESKGRDKAAYTPPPKAQKVKTGNAAWFVPVMIRRSIVCGAKLWCTAVRLPIS